MGNKSSSHNTLKTKEIKEFQVMTHFDETEICALYNHFRYIAQSGKADGVIDKDEFQKALGLKNSLFLNRMFSLFDENNDNKINFVEFIRGLSILCTKGTLAEKEDFSFKIYDEDLDNKISVDELTNMLKASLAENDLKLTEEEISTVVKATFAEVDSNKDGFIDRDEYHALVERKPAILNNMTLPLRQQILPRSLQTRQSNALRFFFLNNMLLFPHTCKV